MDGNLSRHVLVRTVRLTVETNLVTSKGLRAIDIIMALVSCSFSHCQYRSIGNGCCVPRESIRASCAFFNRA